MHLFASLYSKFVKWEFLEGKCGNVKTVSPPRTFNLLLDFVQANVPTHDDVYPLKFSLKYVGTVSGPL